MKDLILGANGLPLISALSGVPVQTSYSLNPALAYPGMISDTGFRDVISRLLETAAGAGAGLFLVAGTDAVNQAKVPTAAGDITDKLLGVSVFQTAKTPANPRYAQKDAVPILRRGRIWVVCDSSGVTAGDSALFIVHTGADAGKVRSTTDATATAIPNGAAKCLYGSAAAGIVLLDLNLPSELVQP